MLSCNIHSTFAVETIAFLLKLKIMAKTSKTPTKAVAKQSTTATAFQGIENHKKAALHLQEAAKYHLEAADHHANGNPEHALNSTIMAHGHQSLAKDAQRLAAKHLVANN